MTQPVGHRRDLVRAEAGSYGLTAVTLGEVLKDQLDKVAEATNGNRSEIIPYSSGSMSVISIE
jgi:hypothetical protein